MELESTFRALSDTTRLRIMNLLLGGETCVGDLVLILEEPQPKVSRHLGQLRRAGLVSMRRDGLWVHYSVARSTREFSRLLFECLAAGAREMPELLEDSIRAAEIRQRGGCCPTSEEETGLVEGGWGTRAKEAGA